MSDHVKVTVKQNTENLMVWPSWDFDLVKYNFSTDVLSVTHLFIIKFLFNHIAVSDPVFPLHFHIKCHHMYSSEASKLL